ncbi:hypothetical protein WICMUC_004183 [Wickerhamomyces mucosus]|uniref:INO80 complex subunit B-like conserved region domain-containing protein n=1 Tax=Wickerhamomyces mucosus TaxID=1378264 RepID=A0A9P8PK43_9ASCO|nr:hypothetical protein WICMUC_004183 [Wickerhamomyces mucosus]
MSDESDLSSIEDLEIDEYDDVSKLESGQPSDIEEEEEDDNDDDEGYGAGEDEEEDDEEEEENEKLKIVPSKTKVNKSKPIVKAKLGKLPKSSHASKTKPAKPSKLSKEIKAPSSRPKRAAAPTINYNDDIEEYEDDVYLEEPLDNTPLEEEVEVEEEEEEEDIIATPALKDIDDEEIDDEYSDYKQRDLTRMTERQRAMLDDNEDNEIDSDSSVISNNLSIQKSKNNQFLSLSNNIRKRRVLTEEENQIRRAEIARKRKNLSEKKLEEEKQDTINKLLKRRAKTTRTKKDDTADIDDESLTKEKPRRPQLEHPALLRWVSQRNSLRLRIPESLLIENKRPLEH